jgi:hypothetical protein
MLETHETPKRNPMTRRTKPLVILLSLFVMLAPLVSVQAQVDEDEDRGPTRAQMTGQRVLIPELGPMPPDSISFQGFLTDNIGTPLNTTVDIVTTFYKGGVAGYAQTHSNVSVSNGIFDIIIGPVDTVLFDQPIAVGIKVGTDPEIAPKTPLQSAPFALGVRGFRALEVVVGNDSAYNIVAGPGLNSVSPTNSGQTIAGGGGYEVSQPVPNVITDDWGTIGGGNDNLVDDDWGTIAGGISNTVGDDGGFIGGGRSNQTGGNWAVIAGGFDNFTGGRYASVLGGRENDAVGWASMIPGGIGNLAADSAFAAGCRAHADDVGSFVWSGSTSSTCGDTLKTTAEGQFLARAPGGVKFFTNSAATLGAQLAPNDGTWGSISDVNVKTGFGETDPTKVLEKLSSIPITTWRYKGQDENITHMGPTAQDFYEAFGLGTDERHIGVVDADGVSMAAIQGLYQLLKQQQAEIERLRALIESEH